MAEAFINSVTRAVGIVTSSPSGSIGVTTNKITGISTQTLALGDMVDNSNYLAGTKVSHYGAAAGEVICDRDSTNESAVSTQVIKFLGVTTAYTSASATKSILIGGTFANNTGNEVELTVEVYDNSAVSTANSTSALASAVPVPYGSSFVVSDAGKTILEGEDELRIYCNTTNGVDVNLGILKGVN